MAGIEHHEEVDLARLLDLDADDVAHLDVIGENRTSPPQDLRALARELGDEDAIQLRDYVSDRELEAAYADAGVFAFLSEYEGFGLTPLEAMARGVAPVVLDTAVAREVYGPAAVYVPPGPAMRDAAGAALLTLLTDPAAHARLVAEGPAVLSHYDWRRTAAETLAILEESAGAR